MGPSFGQLRIGGEAFAPERDVINLTPRLVHAATQAAVAKGWPGEAFRKYAEQNGVPLTALGEAARSLILLTNNITGTGYSSWEEAWLSSGMGKVNPLARAAIFAHLGISTMRAFTHYAHLGNEFAYRPVDADASEEAVMRAAWAMEADLPSEKQQRMEEVPNASDRAGNPIG